MNRKSTSHTRVLTADRSVLTIVTFALFVFFFLLSGQQAQAAENPILRKAVDLVYNAQFGEAEKVLNSYVSTNPGDPLGYMIRGTARDWKQKVQGPKNSLDEVVIEDYKRANEYAFRQWEKDQGNVDRMINLGNSYMYLAKKWLDQNKTARAGLILKKARKHMDEAMQKDPNRYDAYLASGLFNFYASNIPSGLSILASIIGISGNEAKGLQQLKTAATNSNLLQADAMFILTYAYGDTKKNYAQAISQVDQMISRYPNNYYFNLLKGEYAMRGKMMDQAEGSLTKFFTQCQTKTCSQDNLFLANYYMSHVLTSQKKFAQAKPYVQKAEELNGGKYKDRLAFTYLHKGMILKADGKKAEAKAAFQQAMDTSGGNADARKLASQEMQTL